MLWLVLQSTAALAVPTDYAFTHVPSRFQTRELTASSRALGETCLSRGTMPDGTICNPAFLSELSESPLLGRLYLGNGYAALSTANNFIYQPLSKEFLQELFTRQNVTSLEAHAGLSFSSRYFSAEFSPYRVQYTHEVHNPNNAVIAIHAAVEKSFALSAGLPLSALDGALDGFSFGAKLRVLSRDFVHGRFSMFEVAASEEARSLLPMKSQTAVFVDPSVAWTSEGPWKKRVSFGFSNLGRVWPRDPLYPEPADLGFGLGLEPPVGFGSLKLGIDFAELLHGESAMGRFRSGLSYRFGIVEAMAGYNQSATTVGLQFGFQLIRVGIVYEFLRADLEGGLSNRIATEMSAAL